MSQATAPIQRAPVMDETTAIANLPPNLAIIKMENEAMMALATARPRDTKAIMGAIKEEFDVCPELAAKAEYSKPVGRDRRDGPMKFAHGLSIRAAETLNAHFGHTRVRTDVTIIDADTVKVEATFVDYQTGRVWQDNQLVSRYYTAKGGGPVRYTDDRFASTVIPATKSRCIREVILRCMPSGIKAEMLKMAHDRLNVELTPEVVQKLIEGYALKGVTQQQIEDCLGHKATEWNARDRLTLIGIWNAIQDGETTIEEAFGKPDKKLAEEAAKRKEDLKEKLRKQMGKEKPAMKDEQAPPAAAQPVTAQPGGEADGSAAGAGKAGEEDTPTAGTPSSSSQPAGGLFRDGGLPPGAIEPKK